MSSLSYFFSESFKGFARNLSTTLGSVITIFLSLLIIGVFMVGGVIVDHIVNSVEDEVSITAYLADDASQDSINEVEDYIRSLSGVESVSFTTKDQAMENFKNSMSSNPDIVDQLDGQNPLPASINISLSDPQQVEGIANQIAQNDTFKSICDNQSDPSDSLRYGQKTVERLFSLTNYIRYIGIALVILLIFIAFVFINNTIRLSILSRRREIAIERLVGASNNFIRGPFLMEGALQAVIGALLAILVMQLLRTFALPLIQTSLQWLPITVSGTIYALIYLGLIVAGLVIGFIGSMLALRRYLKI